ncbi:MAG: CocE/NonD family hydrolase, partial [Alphaproteobacteria bacterium]
ANRDDVLVFTTDVLADDMELTGPITAKLFAASSARDTDFTVTVTDMFPDGYGNYIQDGIIRASYRESDITPSAIEPGRVYGYDIDLWATSYVVLKGHRLRVEVSSSCFNRYDRNPNTGDAFGRSAAPIKATQTIHHSRQYPSHVTLSVMPR